MVLREPVVLLMRDIVVVLAAVVGELGWRLVLVLVLGKLMLILNKLKSLFLTMHQLILFMIHHILMHG